MTVPLTRPPAVVFAEPGTETPLFPELDHGRPRPAPVLAGKGLTRTSDGVFAQAGPDDPEQAESDGANTQKHHYRVSNKGREFPAEVLTPGEVDAIIGQCSITSRCGIRDRALLTLLYRSGLRIEEILALRPTDVNLADHSLRLLRTKSKGPQTRGYHASADVALARWMEIRKTLGVRSGPLFCTLKGGRIWPQQIRAMLHRQARRAGVTKRVHPHGLRHTFAVELDQAGTPITVISKLLGHSSLSVTSRYLDHLTNKQAIDALQAADLPTLGESR